MLYNSNISVRNNQAFFKYYNIVVEWLNGRDIELKDSEHILMKYSFNENMRKVTEYILKLVGSFDEVHVSQAQIAKHTGLGLRTVHRILGILSKIGLVHKQYRGANRTCLYTRGHILIDPLVKFSLMKILPSLYWASESLARRCKEKFMSILSPLTASFKQVGVRLSNDKNKELNTIKKNIQSTKKTEEIRVEIIRNYEPDPEHDSFFNEFANILGIKI